MMHELSLFVIMQGWGLLSEFLRMREFVHSKSFSHHCHVHTHYYNYKVHSI